MSTEMGVSGVVDSHAHPAMMPQSAMSSQPCKEPNAGTEHEHNTATMISGFSMVTVPYGTTTLNRSISKSFFLARNAF